MSLTLAVNWPIKESAAFPPGNGFGYLHVCPLNLTGVTPKSVSMLLDVNDTPSNNLIIIDNQPPDGVKKKFGVCVKQVSYHGREFVIRFIEWVHMMKILGADKIHVRNRFLNPDTLKAVNYFNKQKLIEMKPFLEPNNIADNKYTWDGMMLEIVIINDCFYRIRNLYEYIVVIDPDEALVPTKSENRIWEDIFKNLQDDNKNVDVFLTEDHIFPHLNDPVNPNYPEYLYMFQHMKVTFI